MLDSNILIYLSKNEIQLESFTSIKDTACISLITYMEVMGYAFNSKIEEDFIRDFCEGTLMIEITPPIVEQVIQLRRKHSIRLPDAIIAASAIEDNALLITRNTVDFKNIDSLQLFNPFERK